MQNNFIQQQKKTPNRSHSSKSNVFTDIVYKTRNKKGLIFELYFKKLKNKTSDTKKEAYENTKVRIIKQLRWYFTRNKLKNTKANKLS